MHAGAAAVANRQAGKHARRLAERVTGDRQNSRQTDRQDKKGRRTDNVENRQGKLVTRQTDRENN